MLARTRRPPADRGNGNDDHGGAGGRPKANAGKSQHGGGGTFQKASIDEAYLEPTRRTLMAELWLSSQRQEKRSSAAAGRPTSAAEAAAPAMEPGSLVAEAKRTCGEEGSECGGHPSALVERTARQWRDGDGSFGRGPSQSQDGCDSGEQNEWNLWTGCSPDDDGQPGDWARRRSRRATKDEEEDDARLLKAGGVLATRIQQTLSDVLQYDCSIGVATNKVSKLVVFIECLIKDKQGVDNAHPRDDGVFGLAVEPFADESQLCCGTDLSACGSFVSGA